MESNLANRSWAAFDLPDIVWNIKTPGTTTAIENNSADTVCIFGFKPDLPDAIRRIDCPASRDESTWHLRDGVARNVESHDLADSVCRISSGVPAVSMSVEATSLQIGPLIEAH